MSVASGRAKLLPDGSAAITRERAQELQSAAFSEGDTLLWRLSVLDGRAVASPFAVVRARRLLEHLEAPTLDELRTLLPLGVARMAKGDGVTEAWI